MCLNCLLLAGECSPKCLGLVICVSGGFVQGWYLVSQCTSDCFDPLELFPLMFLDCRGLLAELWDNSRATVTERVCSRLFCWDLLADSLCLVQNCTFGHCGSSGHFGLAWMELLDPPQYMEVAMEKGARSYLGLLFSTVHKSERASNKSAWVSNKSAWVRIKSTRVGPQVVQPSFWKPIPDNIGKHYISHLPCLTTLELEPSRGYDCFG